ncbi:MAG: hypothetical protein KIS29_01500 [Thermoplasmata archaeon]|nr:hypothetical protein [Candidatus Sysuiplasma jiujiangense]
MKSQYNLTTDQLERVKVILLTTRYYNVAKRVKNEIGVPKRNYRSIMKAHFPEFLAGVEIADTLIYTFAALFALALLHVL